MVSLHAPGARGKPDGCATVGSAPADQSGTGLASRLLKRFDGRSIGARFAKMLGWSVAAFALDKGALLLAVLILAHLLAPVDFGRFVLSQGFVTTAQIAVGVGFGPMLARYIPAFRREGGDRVVALVNLCALSVLTTFCLVAAAGLLGAKQIATSVLSLGWPSPVPYMLIGWVACTSVSQLLSTILLANENGRSTVWVSLAAAPLQIIATPIAADRWGLIGALTTFALIDGLRTVLLARGYAQSMRRSGASLVTRPRLSDTALLWRFGAPVFLISMLWMPTIWISQLLLKSLHPDGLTEVAELGLALNIMGAAMLASSLVDRVSLPMSATVRLENGEGALQRFTRRLSLAQGAGTLVVAGGIALALLLLGQATGLRAPASGSLFLVVCLNAALLASQTAPVNLLLVENRTGAALATMIPWSAMVLLGTFVFHDYGALAIAASMFVANALRVSTLSWLAYRPSSEPVR